MSIAEKKFADAGGAIVRKMSAICMCKAEGCPLRVAFIANTDTGAGLCSFHYSAESPNQWPKITRILNTPECRELRWALARLLAFTLGKSCMNERDERHYICAVQKAGLVYGLERDTLARRTVKSWSGEEFLEGGHLFYNRIDSALEADVLARANGQKGPISGMSEISQSEAEKTLKSFAGKGKRLMGERDDDKGGYK